MRPAGGGVSMSDSSFYHAALDRQALPVLGMAGPGSRLRGQSGSEGGLARAGVLPGRMRQGRAACR